ncbi:condensin complex subunit 1 [Cylas formicarius]|uniref:condensin complex subunit 1 n=1 Tax=Cylas formicarius TaxID=197179 RepID=UPI002958B1FE|nr:condensin complex subunit 1 [Cylas formicarius]
MAHFTFEIPSKKDELLNGADNYWVKNVVVVRDLWDQIKVARNCLKDEGAEFILENFDTYYSILHFGETVPANTIINGYNDLHTGMQALNKTLALILDDKQSLAENEELRVKYLNLLKMITYLFSEMVLMIEHINVVKNKNLCLHAKKKRKIGVDEIDMDKKSLVLTLHTLIQCEISIFWDPPVVEENFLNLVSQVCYQFLSNPDVKFKKDLQQEIFSLLGTMIINYNHGTTFVIRMVQMVKSEVHLVECLAEGVQHLVVQYKCKGLVHDLIREITEWQTDEKYQDSQGSKYCAQVLSSMAVLMPDLMIPELLYLNKYLNHDSSTLRISVLNVITEVILNVLSKPELTEEEVESRNDFFGLLIEHMADVAAHVRSKTFQNWIRLQQESAIPPKYLNEVLEKCIQHLLDKSALVRKSAANCITTFLSHNHYSADLSLTRIREELSQKKAMFEVVNAKVEGIRNLKLDELQAKWDVIVTNLKPIIDEELNNEENETANDEDQEDRVDTATTQDMIRIYLNEGKYRETFFMLKKLMLDSKEFEEFNRNEGGVPTDLYMILCQSIFLNPTKLFEEIRTGIAEGHIQDVTDYDINTIVELQKSIEYLDSIEGFLELVHSAVPTMVELLETTTISDMHEAVQFFITAYKFNIDDAIEGVMAMLHIMQRNEQERRDVVVEAFKKVYLTTDSKSVQDHCVTVVGRLISLLKTVTFDNLPNLELIISEWVAKGILDNNIIDTLWKYFTRKISVSDDDALASVELLRMAALGRNTIISRNIKVVTALAFENRGKDDMVFLGAACEFLAVAGRKKPDITAANPPFKIKWADPDFQALFDILLDKFFEPVPFYGKALRGAIEFVYRLCNKPEKLWEEFVNKILKRLQDSADDLVEVDTFVLIRLCQLLGLVAINQLNYLDETIYKELKRREYIKNQRKSGKTANQQLQRIRETSRRASSRSANKNSILNTTQDQTGDDTMEGAQALDQDAEFIHTLLEMNTVTGSEGLGGLAYIIKDICEQQDIYDDVELQNSAVIALMRYMLVSGPFCKSHIQLLFTLFEKTSHLDVKEAILIHLSDLLTRFPNIIEPWTPNIYRSLKDPSTKVRRTAFFVISGLILQDMVRAHSYISHMADCLFDEDDKLKGMCRTFFITLAHKENNLYNALPDIFCHLTSTPEIGADKVGVTMKFLFGLIDKSKHMENLVERFCSKFRLTEDIQQQRQIAYCLSLITYNDKALKNLHENYPSYKHLLHDSEIYASFKDIMASCSKHQVGKPDLKPLVAELQKTISATFELNQNEGMMGPPPPPPKSVRSRRKRRVAGKKKKSNNDSDSDDERSVRKGTRSRRTVNFEESDSE